MTGLSFADIEFEPKEVVVIKLERYEMMAAGEVSYIDAKKEIELLKAEIINLSMYIESMDE